MTCLAPNTAIVGRRSSLTPPVCRYLNAKKTSNKFQMNSKIQKLGKIGRKKRILDEFRKKNGVKQS